MYLLFYIYLLILLHPIILDLNIPNWDKDYKELYLHDWCSTNRGKNIYCNWSGAHGNFNQMKIYCNIFDNLYLFTNKFDSYIDKCWGDDSCVYYLLEHYKIPFILCDINNKEVKK